MADAPIIPETPETPEAPATSADPAPPIDDGLIDRLQEQLLAAERQINDLTKQLADAGPSQAAEETFAVLTTAGPGSVFTKGLIGDWRITYITPGGAPLFIGGVTIPQALADHGLHVPTDAFGKIHADQVGPQHLTLDPE